ncbi:BrxA family protein [Fusobacterium polymorphum]|uniref:BrxA family protein n=1 Tax=Fusobacterium nucleatum subsp. polymorphum TaxID=76857 RepID=UPI0030097D43
MEYRAITAENFYLIEMKNTCKFILKNKVEEDLKKLLKINNILETVSESNFSKKFNTINKRLKSLTDNLKKQIVDTDLTSARFINLYSILCNERFILEFLEEVVKEKYDNYDYSIKESDFSNYMETKSEQSKVIQNWTAEAKRRMLIKVKNFLTEGGYLEKNKDGYKIIKPIVDLAVIDEIKENGNKKILKIMFY